MIDYERTKEVVKAFANGSRLQILNCIEKGISNPVEIAKELVTHIDN
jgi:hypothetical protein